MVGRRPKKPHPLAVTPQPRTTRPPLLAGYQRRWLADRSPRKLFVKARRIGGSFVVALEEALAAAGFTYGRGGKGLLYRPDRGTDQRIVSASHSQAKEHLEECGRHLRVLEQTVVGTKLIRKQSAERIELMNGCRLFALAPNPRTVRGGGGDLTLDEFGVMPHSKKIWAAAKSVTDPTLGRRYGYKLRVVGTPLGDEDMFFELAETEAGARFSRHRVTIHDAIRDGFPANVDDLRADAGDADIFAQEYECVFLSAAARYISREIWEAATYTDDELPAAIANAIRYAGMDVARKATGDLSVIEELARVAKTLWHMGGEAKRGAAWDAQEAWVAEVLGRCSRIAVDATGMGMQFAERLIDEHGESRVEAVEFTGKSKEMLATGLRAGLEKKEVRPREDAADLKREALSMRRNVTPKGGVTYDIPRQGASHGDHAWALALAVHTAGRPADGGVVDPGNHRSEADRVADIM